MRDEIEDDKKSEKQKLRRRNPVETKQPKPKTQGMDGERAAGGDAEAITDRLDWRDLTPGEKLRGEIPTLSACH